MMFLNIEVKDDRKDIIDSGSITLSNLLKGLFTFCCKHLSSSEILSVYNKSHFGFEKDCQFLVF